MSQGGKGKIRHDAVQLIKFDATGVVKRYIRKGGYGFITDNDTNEDVFFHISAVVKENWQFGDPVRVGDEVIYDLYKAPKGYRAESVQISKSCNEGVFDSLYDGTGATGGQGIYAGRVGRRRLRSTFEDPASRIRRITLSGGGHPMDTGYRPANRREFNKLREMYGEGGDWYY